MKILNSVVSKENKIEQIKKIYSLSKLFLRESGTNQIGHLLPLKPTTLNLLVNDVCNSRCQMCLIWKNKANDQLSPCDLEKVLNDPLFSRLRYIGVSGGEPTLRADLPEIFRVICSKSPSIRGAGIITNGILEEVVKKRILKCADICHAASVPFNVMLSLDGLGEIHDKVRGRENNFQSTLSLLQYFHNETDIPTSFGCTITSENALYVDELLDFAIKEKLYGRFRIAEFIKRLYNDRQDKYIRAFDEKTCYHLGLFFHRLEHTFENSPTIQKTYRNIRSMLVEGKKRQIACPYQTNSVVLTASGELLYCSPKSPGLGSVLDSSAKELYFQNLDVRNQIIHEDCQDCIHDYHVPVSFSEFYSFYFNKYKNKKKYNCQRLLRLSKSQKKIRKKLPDSSTITSKSVLIVGWYGTETVGDKAILWSVINNLKSRINPPKKIILASLYPFISRWTLLELELEDICIVETYTQAFEEASILVDEIVMGGGPLMDLEVLNHILFAFTQAAKNKKIARIEGCGIGPLYNEIYRQVVLEILRLSDIISVRDTQSSQFFSNDIDIAKISVVPDPATNYVQFIQRNLGNHEIDTNSSIIKSISCFLREWTTEYKGTLLDDEYDAKKKKIEENIVKILVYIASFFTADLDLLPMHTFHIGGDDRIFGRALAKQVKLALPVEMSNISVSVPQSVISPEQIIRRMLNSKINICMRFHSVLFAETLGVPYIAIDYTSGGKIKGFLDDKGRLDRLIRLEDIANGTWKNKIYEIISIDLR